MKKIVFLFLCLLSMRPVCADDFCFDHGPYLQNMSAGEVTIFFTTSQKAFSWVEVAGGQWSEPQRFVAVNDGLSDAYTRKNAVRVTGLRPDTEYRYRMVSKEITSFRPYKIVYGDSIVSEWEAFRTFPDKMEDFSFIIINDGHDDAQKVSRLLGLSQLPSADAVFYLGDMMSYIEEGGSTPYSSFIDVSVEAFAKNKPFVAARGNHETRGNMARLYGNYVGHPNDRFYNIYYFGETAVILLDTGEDKPDTHPVYGGINRFDEYRLEQARWLKEQVKSKRFRRTKNRIVLMHIPPTSVSRAVTEEDHAVSHLMELFLPVFNSAKIDLLFSGHTHHHFLFERDKCGYNFPIIINDNKSVVDVSVSRAGIGVKITDVNGNITLERTFK